MSQEAAEQTPAPPPVPEEEEEGVVGASDGGVAVEVADYFPEVGDDLTEVTWAHRVNSLAELEVALQDPNIMMLEADILLGQYKKEEEEGEEGGEGEKVPQPEPQPIMAHPPETTSDLTVAMWLDKVIAANQAGHRKGIKMDFKEIGAVKQSLEELAKRKDQINFPVWLNADILPGQDSPVKPVPAAEFLNFCTTLCPQATLSLGWTTYVAPDSTTVEAGYSKEHVEEMVQTLEAQNVFQPVTFPIRAAFVPISLDNLEWLLEKVPDATLTIWSSPRDPFDPEALQTSVDLLGRSAVYLDLPETQMTQYKAAAAAAGADEPQSGAKYSILPSSASVWATVGMALASALAALYLYE